MDTKWKKSKLVISFLAYFIGLNLLALSVISLLCSGYSIQELREEDYQNFAGFRNFVTDRLETFLDMAVGNPAEANYHYTYSTGWSGVNIHEVIIEDVTEAVAYVYEANEVEVPAVEYGNGVMEQTEMQEEKNAGQNQELHEYLSCDKNLLYSVSYDGKLLYTNSDNWQYDPEKGELPEGYNFLLYFDGQKVTIRKDGEILDVYGDGYYTLNSQWYVPGYENVTLDEEYGKATIAMAVAQVPRLYGYGSYGNNSYLRGDHSVYNLAEHVRRNRISLDFLGVSFCLGVLLLLVGFLMRKSRRAANAAIAGVMGKIYLEFKVIGIFVLFIILLGGYNLIGQAVMRFFFNQYGDWAFIACLCGGFWCLGLVALDWKYNRPLFRHSLVHKIYQAFETRQLSWTPSRRIVFRFVPLLGIWGLAALVVLFLNVIAMTNGDGEFLFVCFCLDVLFAGFSWIFFHAAGKNKELAKDMELLSTKIEAIHKGDYSCQCRLDDKSELNILACQLDDIQAGMSAAIDKQLKSERMKIELITNVSHDLKTPLTSIISYVELLKQEENLPEHVRDYIRVLDEKSHRLNQMVQDVFAVSKAASGQLPVDMEKIDFGKLLRQTLADMNEQIEKYDGLVKVSIPEEEILIWADGKRMYRVFQNLIENALKYSLDGSRIYITLEKKYDIAMASIKNTSAREIDDSVDFTERFVRGDVSRTDGGSGLGLSIAKNFTESCKGKMEVSTNADLFIVTVSFPVVFHV